MDEIATLSIGIAQVGGDELGGKEFIEMVPSSLVGTTFQSAEGATFTVTSSRLERYNRDYDGG